MDHLPLPAGQPLTTRRTRGNPIPKRPVRRGSHGPSLKAQLDTIDQEPLVLDDGEDEDEDDLDNRLVLKLSGETRLASGPLNRMDLVQLGEGAGWTYAVMSTRAARRAISRLLDQYGLTQEGGDWAQPESWANLFDNIEGIEVYGPEDRRDPGLAALDFSTPKIVDVVIWPSSSAEEAQRRADSVRDALVARSIENYRCRLHAIDTRPQSTSIRTDLDTETLESLLREPWVEVIRPPFRPRFTQADLLSADLTRQMPGVSGCAIGVIDGVVSTVTPLLVGRVRESRNFPTGHTFSAPDSHGTRVASIASWGDLSFAIENSPPPQSFPVVSARVLEHQSENELEVAGPPHLTIEEAIRWLASEGVRVISISINRPYAVDSLLPSEVCAAIDRLIKELGVVVVVSSGNLENQPAAGWLQGYPHYLNEAESRIADPGDAALAVTVGALASRDVPGNRARDRETAVAPAGAPAPFTRTGPTKGRTREGALKPEFSCNGGNLVYHHGTATYIDDDPAMAVVTAVPPGSSGRALGLACGTSFAAPAVAHEIARISSRYPDASANLLRALAALSARRMPHAPLPDFDLLSASAYGTPNADNVLESEGPSAILTYQGELETNSTIVHVVPIPPEFARGTSRRTLRVALAYDPPVRRGRREYIAGHMTLEFVRRMPYEEVEAIYSRQPTNPEVKADPRLVRHELPKPGHERPIMEPGSSRLESSTLIRRDFVHGSWDEDDEGYFLVVTHNPSPWGPKMKKEYTSQTYALAVQIVDEDRLDLDVHSHVAAHLRNRPEVVTRIRT